MIGNLDELVVYTQGLSSEMARELSESILIKQPELLQGTHQDPQKCNFLGFHRTTSMWVTASWSTLTTGLRSG